jgi:hypothetical protein
MLFVQSVTYNIADPDDGSCEACKDESRCLSLRSTLNARESRCYWETAGSDSSPPSSGGVESAGGSCHFRDIANDMVRMFIVAALAAIVSAPFALSVQYLTATVLSREVIDEAVVAKERKKSLVLKMERALSQSVSLDLVESCGRSSDEDLKNLRKELCGHFEYLLRAKGKEIRAKQFRGDCSFLLTSSDLYHSCRCQIAGAVLWRERLFPPAPAATQSPKLKDDQLWGEWLSKALELTHKVRVERL